MQKKATSVKQPPFAIFVIFCKKYSPQPQPPWPHVPVAGDDSGPGFRSPEKYLRFFARTLFAGQDSTVGVNPSRSFHKRSRQPQQAVKGQWIEAL